MTAPTWTELGDGAHSLSIDTRRRFEGFEVLRGALGMVHTSTFDGAITYELDASSVYPGDAELAVRGEAVSIDAAKTAVEHALLDYVASIEAKIQEPCTELCDLHNVRCCNTCCHHDGECSFGACHALAVAHVPCYTPDGRHVESRAACTEHNNYRGAGFGVGYGRDFVRPFIAG